jgi:hypothetical protein
MAKNLGQTSVTFNLDTIPVADMHLMQDVTRSSTLNASIMYGYAAAAGDVPMTIEIIRNRVEANKAFRTGFVDYVIKLSTTTTTTVDEIDADEPTEFKFSVRYPGKTLVTPADLIAGCANILGILSGTITEGDPSETVCSQLSSGFLKIL